MGVEISEESIRQLAKLMVDVNAVRVKRVSKCHHHWTARNMACDVKFQLVHFIKLCLEENWDTVKRKLSQVPCKGNSNYVALFYLAVDLNHIKKLSEGLDTWNSSYKDLLYCAKVHNYIKKIIEEATGDTPDQWPLSYEDLFHLTNRLDYIKKIIEEVTSEDQWHSPYTDLLYLAKDLNYIMPLSTLDMVAVGKPVGEEIPLSTLDMVTVGKPVGEELPLSTSDMVAVGKHVGEAMHLSTPDMVAVCKPAGEEMPLSTSEMVAVGKPVNGEETRVVKLQHSLPLVGSRPFGGPLIPLNENSNSARSRLQSDELANIRVFKENCNSVVHIETFVGDSKLGFSKLKDGSGFAYKSEEGIPCIVTNYHVIEQAQVVRVNLKNGMWYYANYVIPVRGTDLAFLLIDAPIDTLKPMTIGVSTDLSVGQKVIAIGSPFQRRWSYTQGHISGLGRVIESIPSCLIQDCIQFDAAINEGSSGGPLLDSSGKLIGINTMIESPPKNAFCGLGFAIPIHTVKRLADQLVKRETVIIPTSKKTILHVPKDWEKFKKVSGPALEIKTVAGKSVLKPGSTTIIVVVASPNGRAGKGKGGLPLVKSGKLDLDNIIKSAVSLTGGELGDKVAGEVQYEDLLEKIPVVNHHSKKNKKRYYPSSLDTSHRNRGRCGEGFSFLNPAIGSIAA